MSSNFVSSVAASGQTETVSFGERFSKSVQFDRVFSEGMELVERTAAYLDNQGRADARKLKPPVSLTYATESMRLTTRLLELAAWLLIRRSLKNGEITPEDAVAKRARLKLGGSGRPTHISQFDALPATLRGLIEESFQLTDRIIQLDRAIDPIETNTAGPNPVADQRAQIERAFNANGLQLVVNR